MSKVKKQQQRLKRNKRRKHLKVFAAKLNRFVPKSEVWFRQLFLPYRTIDDQFNVPFCNYIPDVINKRYRYVIEVDGSIHDTKEQQIKDNKKDRTYKSTGFTVIRVKAYDMNSLQNCLNKVCELKGPHFKPAKIYKPKALVEIGSGPENCMVQGDNSRGCLIEIKDGNESEIL